MSGYSLCFENVFRFAFNFFYLEKQTSEKMPNVFDKSWEPAETVSDGGIWIAYFLSLYFDGTSGTESN